MTRIGNYAFCESTYLAEVIIGNNVETIGTYAFGDSPSLSNLTFGDNLQTIGNSAFSECSSLSTVSLGDNLQTIGNSAFSMCSSLSTVSLGDNLQTIGDFAFYECSSLSTVSLGDNLQTIGDFAFYECTSLTTVSLGSALQSIGLRGFMNCAAITSITSKNPVPPTLGSNCFQNVPSTAKLYVPCSAMGDYGSASQWKKFDIQNLPSIENAQIDGIYYVLETCALTATVTHSGYTESNTDNGSYSGEVTIPETVTYENETYAVTRTGNYAFRNCTSLTNVTIGDNVQDIGNYAFAYSTSLANVTLSDNVQDIGTYAFRNCSSLADIILGDNVQSIKDGTFRDCTSLGTVILGKSLQTIGLNAFNGCITIASITSKNPAPPEVKTYAFRYVPTTAVLYVPCSAVDAYAAASGWSAFSSNIEGTAETIEVSGIYYEIPCNDSHTATVVYDDSYATLYSIGIEDFEYNNVQYTVTAIADGAFDGLENLMGIDCHSNISTIGANAFRNCTGLEYFGFYDNTTPPTLGEGAFEGLGLDTLRLMVPFCSQYDYSIHPVFGQFGEIFGNGPCEYNFYNATGDKQWDNPANWQDANFETCTEAPGAGAQVAIFEDCEIGADVTVGSITISDYYDEEYGYYERLTVKDGATLTATDFIYTTGDERNFIIEDGAQVYHPNTGAKATVQKAIAGYVGEKDNYYLIGYSFAENGAVDGMTNLLANDYDLYYYDEPTHYWMNQEFAENGFTELEGGKGYLYANSQTQTIGLKGTLEAGNATVNMPLSYTATAGRLKGFNLVGNPFAHNVTAFAGNDVADEVYQLNDLRDEVVVGLISASHPLKPGEGFFVKTMAEDASITFNDNGGAKGGVKALESVERPTITLNLTQDNLLIDRFILKRDGEPLEKFTLNENGTKVYSLREGQEMAVVPIEGNEQPVNFKAAKNGTYTLTVNVENMDLDYLHLIDNMTGADVDLLGDARHCVSTAYTFTAKTTDYASRFRLVFSTNCGDAIGDNAPFAYVSNGNIVVVGNAVGDAGTASLQVVDVMGRVLVCRDALNASAISTTGIPAGVYVLRLIDGENVRTQKMVIE